MTHPEPREHEFGERWSAAWARVPEGDLWLWTASRRRCALQRTMVPNGPHNYLEIEESRAAVQVLRVEPQLRRQDLLAVPLIGIGPCKEICLVVILELCKAGDAGLS